MSPARRLVPACGALLALALSTGGCGLATRHIVLTWPFTDPLGLPSPETIAPIPVEFAELSEWQAHHEHVGAVDDAAVLGDVSNDDTTAVVLEGWVMPGVRVHTTADAVRADTLGVRAWGPVTVPAGGSLRLGWDRSAALFNDAGRRALRDVLRADGVCTCYVISTGVRPWAFTVRHGSLVVTMSAGG